MMAATHLLPNAAVQDRITKNVAKSQAPLRQMNQYLMD
jgi:hypothetical protein